jgi:release factor glutamine methyltransferase
VREHVIARRSAASERTRRWLEFGARLLAEAGIENAALDASLLLAEACGVERVQLLVGSFDVKPAQVVRFKSMLARRAVREPLAYILGRKEFFSLELLISPDVLIPRPETETLVETALLWARAHSVERILELGTGSGAIALALAWHLPQAQIIATDISESALAIAVRNARRLGCAERVEFRRGDWWSALDNIDGKPQSFDMVLANPPYVAQGELARLAPEVREHEPKIALLSGVDGLACFRKIACGLRAHLASGGYAAFEVGLGQAEQVAQICRDSGAHSTRLFRDLAGIERVVAACF